jgi:hypothetical protein
MQSVRPASNHERSTTGPSGAVLCRRSSATRSIDLGVSVAHVVHHRARPAATSARLLQERNAMSLEVDDGFDQLTDA